MANEERNEAPTTRRRQEARRRGQIPKSQEVSAAIGILIGFLLLRWMAEPAFVELRDYMTDIYRHLPTEDLTAVDIGDLALGASVTFARVVGPVAVGVMLCGLVANVLQVGFVLTLEPMKPKLEKLDPIKGLSRMFSMRTLFDLGKTLLKAATCSLVLYQVIASRQHELFNLRNTQQLAAVQVLGEIAMEMGLQVGALLAIIAVLDYGFQRLQNERQLRMSRRELKEEMRLTEGDPYTRARIRGQQRAWARRRMLTAVPKADVVVTNPTHLAIALQYDAKSAGAPKVVAKGERLTAERIIAMAQEHKVPIVRNIPLAHALYRTVEVGDEIPATLYKAVAEVLAFVYRLREERRAVAARG